MLGHWHHVPLNFGTVGKLSTIGICSETQNLGMTTQHFGKFRGKIKIMSTHDFW